jgi:hypothetical protein
MTEILIPLRTYSEANLRTHWAKRARRVRRQREAARMFVRARLAAATLAPHKWFIRLTRISPRGLDSDNLVSALKAIRDGVADGLEMDDGDERLTWLYAQRMGKPGEYAVLVNLEPKDQ